MRAAARDPRGPRAAEVGGGQDEREEDVAGEPAHGACERASERVRECECAVEGRGRRDAPVVLPDALGSGAAAERGAAEPDARCAEGELGGEPCEREDAEDLRGADGVRERQESSARVSIAIP